MKAELAKLRMLVAELERDQLESQLNARHYSRESVDVQVKLKVTKADRGKLRTTIKASISLKIILFTYNFGTYFKLLGCFIFDFQTYNDCESMNMQNMTFDPQSQVPPSPS